MSEPDPRKSAVAATFAAVAATYEQGPARLWEPIGYRLVELAAPPVGGCLLDVCCGAGAATLAAAKAVGPQGSVVGIDLSEDMLAVARRRATEQGYANVELRTGDLEELDVPDESFDAVTCSLGVFFVPDTRAAARELWRAVRPGGRLAISVWCRGAFEPLNGLMSEALAAERPGTERGSPPYGAIGDPDALRSMLEGAGLPNIEVALEPQAEPLDVDTVWKRITTGGFRATLDTFDEEARARIRADLERRYAKSGATEIDVSIQYAWADKPISDIAPLSRG